MELVRQLEKDILHKKCIGLRRAVNAGFLEDEEQLRLFALGDVADEHMEESIQRLIRPFDNELTACMMMETLGFVKLPRMIHYFDKNTCHKICQQALRQVLLERIFPKLIYASEKQNNHD